MKTLQEIFTEGVTHMLTQNQKSTNNINGYDACAYRGHGGLKCPVGYFIKDRFYNKDLEGENITNMLVIDALYQSDINTNNNLIKQLLIDLQTIHDHEIPSNWKKSLTLTAEKYNLVMPTT
jgi:hypothetical protein